MPSLIIYEYIEEEKNQYAEFDIVEKDTVRIITGGAWDKDPDAVLCISLQELESVVKFLKSENNKWPDQ